MDGDKKWVSFLDLDRRAVVENDGGGEVREREEGGHQTRRRCALLNNKEGKPSVHQ